MVAKLTLISLSGLGFPSDGSCALFDASGFTLCGSLFGKLLGALARPGPHRPDTPHRARWNLAVFTAQRAVDLGNCGPERFRLISIPLMPGSAGTCQSIEDSRKPAHIEPLAARRSHLNSAPWTTSRSTLWPFSGGSRFSAAKGDMDSQSRLSSRPGDGLQGPLPCGSALASLSLDFAGGRTHAPMARGLEAEPMLS